MHTVFLNLRKALQLLSDSNKCLSPPKPPNNLKTTIYTEFSHLGFLWWYIHTLVYHTATEETELQLNGIWINSADTVVN